MKGSTKVKALVAAASAVAMLFPLAACGGSDTASADDDKELTISWYYASGGADTYERVIKQFKKENPDIKVKEVHTSFPQMQKNGQLIMQADDAPDVIQYNQGTSSVGNLASQGILSDLSDYAKQYGWDKEIPTSMQTIAKYKADENGVMSSDGQWYGVPTQGEYTLAYYNKDMFDKNGIAIPKTFDELTAAMQKFVDKGITPVAFEGSETAAQHLWYELALSKANRQWVDNYQSYAGKVNWKSEPFTYAANTIDNWVKKGYIPSNSGGLVAEDMITQFCAGKYPIMFSGSWWFGRINQDGKFKSEFATFPGNEKLSTAGSGKLWVVPEKSKHKGAAAKFLNFMLGKETQNMLGTEAGLPVDSSITPTLSEVPTLMKNPQKTFDNIQDKVTQMNSVYQTLLKNNAVAYYPDWPSASMYDALNSALQGLINQKSTPDKATAEIEAAYNEGKEDLGIE